MNAFRIGRLLISVATFSLLIVVASANVSAQAQLTLDLTHEVNVLGLPAVLQNLRDDFELSEGDAQALRQISLDAVRQNGGLLRELRIKLSRLSEEEAVTAKAELFENVKNNNATLWANAEQLLNENQIARVRQLRYQRMGVDILADPEVVNLLELGETHAEEFESARSAFRTKIEELKVEHRERVRAAVTPAYNRDEMIRQNKENAEEMVQVIAEFEAGIYEEMLDEQQRILLADIRGEVLDFNPPRR